MPDHETATFAPVERGSDYREAGRICADCGWLLKSAFPLAAGLANPDAERHHRDHHGLPVSADSGTGGDS